MNYLAHGFRYLDRPDFLAGTALPDWLSVIDRSIRFRDLPVTPPTTEIESGVRQHLADDQDFHENPAFEEVSSAVTRELRARCRDPQLRAHFLGHLLTELLLDAELIAEDPTRVDRYYESLTQVSAESVAWEVERLTGRRPHRLESFMEAFHHERFIACYLDDARLWHRVTQVVRRVGLPPLPVALTEAIPAARQHVRGARARLV